MPEPQRKIERPLQGLEFASIEDLAPMQPESTYNLRTATEPDLVRVTEIYSDAVVHGTASFEVEAPDIDTMRARWVNLRDQDYPYFVYEQDGRVLGYAYAGAFRPRPAYKNTVEDSVYVDPKAQGQGIGRVLLGALIAACDTRGYREMIAVIGDSASTASIELHRRMGFREAGTLYGVGYKRGRWLNSVYMQKSLNAAQSNPANGP